MAPHQDSRFRTIQPAPLKRERSGADSGSSSAESSGSPWLGNERATKRLKAVTQACHACRRYKMRCDGGRPTCGGCASRGIACGYEGEAGQSRQAAMKARLQALEKLVRSLQSKSEDEAGQLLQRIRTTNDILSLSRDEGVAQSSPSPPGPSPTASASSASSHPRSSPVQNSNAVLASDDSSRPLALTPSPRAQQGLRVHATSQLFHLVLPSPELTRDAVKSFWRFSGRLLELFSQRDTDRFYKAMFGLDGQPDISQKVAICCLCVVAALGVQNCDDFEKGTDEIFFDVSRHFFTDVLEQRPLDAIKVCALYTLYNILKKATVALFYVEIGLSMSRSLHTALGNSSPLSRSEYLDFRRTWRTLIFFSSWMSSTLGYISSTSYLDFEQLVLVSDETADHFGGEIGELVQAAVTKIALLKADILRNHLASGELSAQSMETILKELNAFHAQIPPQLQLRSLQDEAIPPLVRWAVYNTHLLYLGAFMLVYRRVAARCVRAYSEGKGASFISGNNPTLVSLLDQGLAAAKGSCRILNLLLREQGVFRRCWIAIFQTNTACTVILHSVAQKQLHGFPPSSWAHEMEQAQTCLDVLEFCGAVDPVALRFRGRLWTIYNKLLGLVSQDSTKATECKEGCGGSPHPSLPAADGEVDPSLLLGEKPVVDYLFTIPPGANPQLLRLSFTLLVMLCRPWEGPDSSGSCFSVERQEADQPLFSEDDRSQLLGRLDWDFGKVSPFRWDTSEIGTAKADVTTNPSCFLDSEAPSGWLPAQDFEVEGE